MPIPPQCESCDEEMAPALGVRGSPAALVISGVVFAVGLVCLFLAWPFNFVLGPLLMIGAVLIARKRTRIWRCERCGAERKRGGTV